MGCSPLTRAATRSTTQAPGPIPAAVCAPLQGPRTQSWTLSEGKHQHCALPLSIPACASLLLMEGSCPPCQILWGISTPILIAQHVTGLGKHLFQHSTGLCQTKPQPSGFIPFVHSLEFYSYPRDQCCFVRAGFWVYSHFIFSMSPGKLSKGQTLAW